ncbi:MAG: SpoIID/LytB domain-containing protein [Bacillota bacterium]
MRRSGCRRDRYRQIFTQCLDNKQDSKRSQTRVAVLMLLFLGLSLIPVNPLTKAATLPEKIKIGVVTDSSSLDFGVKQGTYSLVDSGTGRTIVDSITKGDTFRAQLELNTAHIGVYRYLGSPGGEKSSVVRAPEPEASANTNKDKSVTAARNGVNGPAEQDTTTGEDSNQNTISDSSDQNDENKKNQQKQPIIVGDWEYIGAFKGPICLKPKGNSSSSGSTPSHLFRCDSRRYRGQLEIRVNAGRNGLTGINELPLEEYLYGVVGREVSSGWPLEALKAQAIIARTYAVRGLNRHISEGYNLCSTTNCQAYGGYDYEAESIIRSVKETSGQVLLDNQGQLAVTLYHSNSGGYTENNVNVFGADLPYLQGRPDPYSLGYGLADWSYSTVVNGKNSRGEDGLRDLLLRNNPSFGLVDSIELVKYPSGRVDSVIIKDDRGNTITMTGGSFGSLFNPNYATVSRERVMGRLFDLNTDAAIAMLNGHGERTTQQGGVRQLAVVSASGVSQGLAGVETNYFVAGADGKYLRPKAPGTLEFQGHGWGHGVGLSQWGAYGMAQQGFKYQEILDFYYPGTQLSR